MKSLIFDLDGTLWDATDSLTVLWQRELHAVGIMREMTRERMIGGMGMGPEELAAHLAPELPVERRRPFFKHVTSLEPDFIPAFGAKLYPGMVETLRYLAKDYKLMIASNCVDGYIECFLGYAGLTDTVTDFAHPGITGLSKAGNIRLLMERNKIDEAIMIGDALVDYTAAVEAGIPFIYASYGFGQVAEAKCSINAITELPALLTGQMKWKVGSCSTENRGAQVSYK